MTLVNGDSLKLMKTTQKVDAIITDPPFGLNYRDHAWDGKIPPWLDLARQISPIVIFTTAPTTIWDYPKPDWMCIWHRRAAASRTAQGGFNHYSPILVYGKVKFSIDYYETLFGKTIHENADLKHPSPKPLELYKWLVSESTEPGQTVLDPFMGSGTTGVACIQLGREFIGYESDTTYFSEAEARLKGELSQTTLNLT